MKQPALLVLCLALAAPLAAMRSAADLVMGDSAVSSDCPNPPTPTPAPTPEPTPEPTALPTPAEDPLLKDLAGLGFEAVWESPGVLLVTLSDEKTHFDVAQDTLKPEGIQRLAVLAGVLVKYPGNTLQIDGHTDARGRAAFNQGLSRRRAERVRGELAGHGVPMAAFTRVDGWGPDKPLADNATEEGRAKNRRVEVRIRFHQLELTPLPTALPGAPASPTSTPTPAPEAAASPTPAPAP